MRKIVLIVLGILFLILVVMSIWANYDYEGQELTRLKSNRQRLSPAEPTPLLEPTK